MIEDSKELDKENEYSKLEVLVDYTILFIVSLAPTLWLRGTVLLTEDFNLPKHSKMLDQYFYAWSSGINLGFAPYDIFQALLFFSFQSWVSSFEYSLQTTQSIIFVFWFFAPGITFYYFLSTILPAKILKYGRLPGTIFYMTATSLIPIWQGFNIANLSGYTFGPILMGIFIKVVDGKMSFPKGAAAFGVTSFFGCSLGVNTPFLFVFSIPFILYPLSKVVIFVKDGRYKHVLGTFNKSLVFAFIFILANAFWLIPLVYSLSGGGGSGNVLPGFQKAALSWLDGLSTRTSLLNVMRLQGAWTWETGFGFDLYDPYSVKYLENPVFIIGSFIFPLLAFAAPFIYPRIDKTKFFVILAIIGIMGGAGTHRPTGPLYEIIFETVPLMWLVRSPWYKFSFLTTFSFGVLFSITIGWVVSRYRNRDTKGKFFKTLLSHLHLIMVGFTLVYASPLLLGEMFPDERKTLPLQRVRIPEYSTKMIEYINENDDDWRILSLPTFTSFHQNDWGFYGFRSLVFHGSSANVIEKKPLNPIISRLYDAFINRNLEVYSGLIRQLRIDHILYEEDAWNGYFSSPIEHKHNNKFINSMEGIEVEKRFGKWTLYKLTDTNKFHP